jgi:hypothetical protein
VGAEDLDAGWPPPEARFQGALFYGESHLRKGEYLKAAMHFRRAAEAAGGEERELARGLVHLAAAGQKGILGDPRGRERQLEHARRRLAPFLPHAYRLDIAGLLELAERPRVERPRV